jgi:TPR repeat protein
MQRIASVLLAFSLLQSFPARADGPEGDVAFAKGDYAEAYRLWRAAADAGQPAAMVAVGTLYDTGHGVPQDFAAALSWYRRAAEAGNVRAMFNVAQMYDNGRGTKMDRGSAILWYRAAAEHGHGRAAYDLAVIYRDGDGVTRDPAAAVRFFRLAADHGIAAARPNLIALGAPAPPAVAVAAVPRREPPIDPGPAVLAAFARFQRAALAREPVDPAALNVFQAMLPTVVEKADHGDGLAEYDLGFAYQFGIGVRPNLLQAYQFYVRAATSPETEVQTSAFAGASAVEGDLTDEEQSAARESMARNAR